MNRRAFLGTLAAGLAGAALDPERLLWIPGRKSYHFISRPFQAGDFVFRNPAIGLARWGVAQSADVLRPGGEFGVYDGLRVQTHGVITAKTEFHGRTIWFTESTVWSTLNPS